MEITYGLISTVEHKSEEIRTLIDSLNDYFKDRNYSEMVETYEILIICVSPEYDQFFKPKRPRYCENRSTKKPKYLWEEGTDNMYHTIKTIFIDFKLDFESFANSNKLDSYTIFGNNLLRYLKEIKYPLAIRNSFDRERFNKDMRTFFENLGCKLDVE